MKQDLDKSHSEYEGLYVLKAVCAYLIVILHCNFPKEIGVLFEVLARIGVPCFFLMNGFFVYPYNEKKIENRIFHTLKLIIGVEIVYMLAALISVPSNFAIAIRRFYFSEEAFNSLICLSRYGLFGAGWYLYALLSLYILYYLYNYFIKCRAKVLVSDKLRERCIAVLAVILLAIHIWVQYLLKFNEIKGDKYTSNVWLMGIPFFVIGVITKKDGVRKKLELSGLIGIFLGGGVLALLQRLLIFPSDLYIGTILSAYAAFLYFLNKSEYRARVLIRIGKLYSKYIYLTHLLVLMILNEWEKHVSLSEVYLYVKPILLCVITTFFAQICYMLIHMCMMVRKLCDKR